MSWWCDNFLAALSKSTIFGEISFAIGYTVLLKCSTFGKASNVRSISQNQPQPLCGILGRRQRIQKSWKPSYNVAQPQTVHCVRDTHAREFFRPSWGPMPSWPKDKKTRYRASTQGRDPNVHLHFLIFSSTPSHIICLLWETEKCHLLVWHIVFQKDNKETHVRDILKRVIQSLPDADMTGTPTSKKVMTMRFACS
jgi:hypothetical protein